MVKAKVDRREKNESDLIFQTNKLQNILKAIGKISGF